ncbi:hypothetical protein IE53DRAFT_386767 [Violaceomyces palustris]|uniref:Uncharacterized protein n=1 Tax=Violaceomyces palustris TaxID=1673888 RepID=A0ACD0NYE7_9BASI|nr:hypothetical protein IE53DRAFT_386767 [Violaceomyces palustris]
MSSIRQLDWQVRRSKQDLLRSHFKGLGLSQLKTPCLLIDKKVVEENCERMRKIVTDWGVDLRCHVKTHKTPEITRIQLQGVSDRVIVSTLAEAWGLLDPEDGLVKDGSVRDILYGVPVGAGKLEELWELREVARSTSPCGEDFKLRLIVDHPKQVEQLDLFLNSKFSTSEIEDGFSVFVKVETGSRRAGVVPDSPNLEKLLRVILASRHVSLHGFYAHAGHSYDSRGMEESQDFLSKELSSGLEALEVSKRVMQEDASRSSPVRKLDSDPLVLSVGSTPTAHAASQIPSDQLLERLGKEIKAKAKLELHAGNFALLDLQQVATSSIPSSSSHPSDRGEGVLKNFPNVALSVLAEVVSEYPQRSSKGQSVEWSSSSTTTQRAQPGDEVMVDAGAIAMSKDRGPLEGFGIVVHPTEKIGWRLERISQEHGVCSLSPDHHLKPPTPLKVGERVRILPQHACLTCAQHPAYFVIQDGGDQVVDVWVPWKGW